MLEVRSKDRTSAQDLQELVNHFNLDFLTCSSSAPEAPARGPAATHSMHMERKLWESKEHHARKKKLGAAPNRHGGQPRHGLKLDRLPRRQV